MKNLPLHTFKGKERLRISERNNEKPTRQNKLKKKIKFSLKMHLIL
jgi:hypothetical protein